MTLFRVEHSKTNPYTMVNRTITEDSRLSWKAKGLWLYAFSRPDDWRFYMADLIKRSTDGKEAVSSGLKELEKAGYLHRSQTRVEGGKMGPSEWVFYETPREIQKISPQPENPSTVNPMSDNPPLLSNNPLPSKKEQQPPKAKEGCCSSHSRKIGEIASLSEAQSLAIAEEFKGLSEKEFDEAIAAYHQYAEKTHIDSHIATVRKALSERWKPNTDRKAIANEEALKARELEGKHSDIGFFVYQQSRRLGITAVSHGHYLEIKLDQWPTAQLLKYSDSTFPEQLDNILRKAGSSLRDLVTPSGK